MKLHAYIHPSITGTFTKHSGCGDWGKWSVCSMQINARRSRIRNCTSGTEVQHESCNNEPGDVTNITPESQYCYREGKGRLLLICPTFKFVRVVTLAVDKTISTMSSIGDVKTESNV